MAPGHYSAVPAERLREQWIVESRQKNQQRATMKTRLDKAEHFFETGRHGPWMQIIDCIAASKEMGHAAAGADKLIDLVAEGQQAEMVALTVGGDGEHECRSNEL